MSIKKIALTFDDTPSGLHTKLSPTERREKITSTLRSYGLKPIFFSNPYSRINEANFQQLIEYANEFNIAHHGNNHLFASEIEFNQFEDDFIEAHKHLFNLKNYKKLYRFPYLDEPVQENKRKKIKNFLSDQGYKIAYTTVLIEDWYFNKNQWSTKRYLNQISSELNFQEELIKYYNLSLTTHVLGLHENDLNADSLSMILDSLSNKYEVIDKVEFNDFDENAVQTKWGYTIDLLKQKLDQAEYLKVLNKYKEIKHDQIYC
jgi:peptidoglycan/xylan/chitin deacetylase (PgdA/CDA1 family)